MMMLRNLAAAVTSTLVLGWSLSAGAAGYTSYTPVLAGGTLIDFESLAAGALVDTQFAGVTFGQTPGGRPQIDRYPWLFGYGSSSGDQVLTGSTEGGNPFNTVAGITATFDTGKSAVEFFFADSVQLGDYPIVFYGKGGAVLGGLTIPHDGSALPPGYAGGAYPPPGTFPRPGLFVGFTSAGDDIYGVGIGPGGATYDSFAIDDLRFLSTAASVPEPGGWMLMILGLGLAGASLRRRDKALVRPLA
jgi:hypothetical protein